MPDSLLLPDQSLSSAHPSTARPSAAPAVRTLERSFALVAIALAAWVPTTGEALPTTHVGAPAGASTVAAASSVHAGTSPALAEVQQVYRTAGAQEALRRVGTLITQHPDDPSLRFQQGVMLAEQRRGAEAIKVFQRLAHDFPDMPEAFNNLAVLYAEQGQIDKASATLEQAMRTRPNYGTAFDNLRTTYTRLAGRAYAKALQIEETPAAPKLALIQELYEPPATAAPMSTQLTKAGA